MNANNNITETTAPIGAPELYTPEDIMAIMRIGRSSVYKLFGSEGFPSISMVEKMQASSQAVGNSERQ